MTNQQLWQAILGDLEIQLSKANFNTWFKNTSIIEKSEDTITVGVPSLFVKSWINNKFHADILKSLKTIEPEIKHVKYQLLGAKPTTQAPATPSQANTPSQTTIPSPASSNNQTVFQKTQAQTVSMKDIMPNINIGLNPRYVFETLIVGKNNELAHAAALSVSQNPGTLYNPLFLYGGVGLGKTHLMHAVGNKFLQQNPRANILYITAEKFTNDFVDAIRNKNMDSFKKSYRSVDMLLLDDIQFFAGKDGSQEEFFHTFNELRDGGKQIIITCDRLPKEIPSIEQRLVSRFEWGMIADIQPPDLETRMAILRSKLAKKGVVLKEDILFYLAENVLSNVRELEGALNRLVVYQQMENRSLFLDQAKQLLASMINSKKKATSVKKIAHVVAEFYNLTLEDLIKQSRRKEFVKPRQIAMFIIRKELDTSFPAIGEFFGGRDHTTVIHGVEKTERLITSDPSLKQEIDLIIDKLYNT